MRAGLQAQHEAPAVVDHHFIVGMRRVVPALENDENRQSPSAQVEGAGSLVTSRSPIAVHADLHVDKNVSLFLQ